MIQSSNNLGGLALHITFIRNFANGVALWPDNPIYVFSKLRYPAGMDLFNGLLCLVHVDLTRGLVWTGLMASLATFYGFYRWAGAFGVAGFLFNGGIAGFQFFKTLKFLDFQGEKTIAWKSIALSMFVTQRGLLFAIPGWRAWKIGFKRNQKLPEEIAFLLPAFAIFVSGLLFQFAPWDWDNLKLMIWAYFLVLPLLWSQLIARWSVPVRAGVCIAL